MRFGKCARRCRTRMPVVVTARRHDSGRMRAFSARLNQCAVFAAWYCSSCFSRCHSRRPLALRARFARQTLITVTMLWSRLTLMVHRHRVVITTIPNQHLHITTRQASLARTAPPTSARFAVNAALRQHRCRLPSTSLFRRIPFCGCPRLSTRPWFRVPATVCSALPVPRPSK